MESYSHKDVKVLVYRQGLANNQELFCKTADVTYEADIEEIFTTRKGDSTEFAPVSHRGGVINLNYFLTGADFFADFSNQNPVSIVIGGKDDGSEGLYVNSGHLTSYSTTCQPNSLIRANVSIAFFEELKGSFTPNAVSYLDNNIIILNSTDTSVETLSNESEILSFKYGYDIEIEPNYRATANLSSKLGNSIFDYPYVRKSAPRVGLSMDVYDYEYYLPATGLKENFKINFKDKNGNSKLLFNINGRVKSKGTDFSVGNNRIHTKIEIVQHNLGVSDSELPSITSIQPESGKSGETVKLQGNNFINVQKVLFGSFPCKLSGDYSSTELNFYVPENMSSGYKAPIHLITEGAEASSPTGYLITGGILTYGY
jgi:hypothetical protein